MRHAARRVALAVRRVAHGWLRSAARTERAQVAAAPAVYVQYQCTHAAFATAVVCMLNHGLSTIALHALAVIPGVPIVAPVAAARLLYTAVHVSPAVSGDYRI